MSAHAPARTSPSRRGATWVPNQHGAWPMLLVPFVVGAVRGAADHGLAWTLLTNRVHPTRHFDSGIVALRRAVGDLVNAE